VSTAEQQPRRSALTSARRLVDVVLRARTFGIVVVLGVLVLISALIQSRFVGGGEIRFILSQTTLYALVAVGEAMVILTRNVDLSVGSVVGLSAYVSANMFGTHPGISIILVFLVGLGVGLVCGIVTGAITAIGRVPSLVVTLAMLYIIRGVDTIIVGSGVVLASTEPNSFLNIPQATVLGIPDVALAVAVVVAIAAYYLNSFRSGRDLYAIGSDPDAARRAGIPIAKRVFTAFVISGALSGVAGVIWAAQYATIESTAATGLELQVDRSGGRRRSRDLRRQRQRGGRRAGRAAFADDQLVAQRDRHLVDLDRGDLRPAADRRDHA